jgi:hypothetical protein
VTPCFLVDGYQRSGGTAVSIYRAHFLKMEAASSSETLMPTYVTMWRHTPEVRNLEVKKTRPTERFTN